MKPINTSTFDFPTLIKEGFVYVDKTRQIYELVRRDTDCIYFFPRPRRFGKSLLYQGGYLTIDKRVDDDTVLLKIPNYEVREALEDGYISNLLGRDHAAEVETLNDLILKGRRTT